MLIHIVSVIELKRLVERLSPAAQRGNLSVRQSIVVDTRVVHRALIEIARVHRPGCVPLLTYRPPRYRL